MTLLPTDAKKGMLSAVSVCGERWDVFPPRRARDVSTVAGSPCRQRGLDFHFTSSCIQPCSPYLMKHLRPTVQECHRCRWDRTASQCVLAFACSVAGNMRELVIMFQTMRLWCQLWKKLIKPKLLGGKWMFKNRLTRSALQQGRRVMGRHSEREREHDNKWV